MENKNESSISAGVTRVLPPAVPPRPKQFKVHTYTCCSIYKRIINRHNRINISFVTNII